MRAFLGREPFQTDFGWQFDIDAQAIRVTARLRDQLRIGIGNGFQMDIPAKQMFFAQRLRDAYQLLHRVVRRADHAGTEKQPVDVIAPVKVEREAHDFLGCETRARHVARAPVHAILTVVQTEIGQQDFQQRHASAVGREAVADARARARAEPVRAARTALWRAAARTRRVVLGGVGEYFELFEQFHGRRRHCIYVQYSTPSRAVHKARIAANAAAVPDLSYFSVDKLNSGGFCLHTTSQLAGGAVQSLQPRAESTYRRFEASVLSR